MKVTPDKLKRYVNLSEFNFTTTDEVEPLRSIIGQERARKAFEFGLKINTKGYNIYMCGPTGTGKTSFAESYLKEVANQKPAPNDWVYVYNFSNPDSPIAIGLPKGMGRVFKKDMSDFVESVVNDLKKVFASEEYENDKNNIYNEYQEKRTQLLDDLAEEARRYGFEIKYTPSGVYFIPIVDGKAISEAEYPELDKSIRDEMEKKIKKLQLDTQEVLKKIKLLEKESKEKIKELQKRIAVFTISHYVYEIRNKYKENQKILDFIDGVTNDVVENLEEFLDRDDEEQGLSFQFLQSKKTPNLDKYKVNVIVDNSDLDGAPVVYEVNPTYYNLIGKIEYENEMGNVLVTDFTKIKAGAIHRANGGYLILQAKDILSYPQAWEALKRVLKTGEIVIENLKDIYGLFITSTLKPEPIPVDLKVILIGNEYIYNILYAYDEDFRKLFKIKADFDSEMEYTQENVYKMIQFISSFCKKENALPFSKEAVEKVVEYSCRLVENQEKLSTRFNDIVEILAEASTWAQLETSDVVKKEHVIKAICEKEYRSSRYEEKINEMIEDGTILVDVDGYKVGQINALAILDVGDYVFGKPSRITVTTSSGRSGIINIEREVQMSGKTHSKGIMIISGYIAEMFAQDMPLTLNATICFEQLYSGIEGDSASAAELCALLSALSDVPIYQGIAITGSINQKGEIQPVGGVTKKVEGFYYVCKKKGFTGKQGVIIPYQNIKNLVLCDEVIEDVKDGNFHIWAVKSIDEAMEILTGRKFKEIVMLSKQKLRRYLDNLTNINQQNKEKEA
ncbi:ATP-binding protein [Caldicellulosiruptor changbaiensis]|uniref:endopeptidase La n=1 Tax=Caldicellulosiruptor changbaiensis TaxID=1222016 RepID=A0A3T0D4V2_9FIRM|nr:ATP-binding protein [Caldicellulosiruptor changbaiensis]AZT90079.1 ATP-binding protein [Caldicellulosiruptor changbaiensis]